MRVLITNIWLNRGGTESVVRDISLGLSERGHSPIVYSPSLGEIAQEISARGIPVIDDLACVGDPPDIIHAHHFVTAGEAFLAFPEVPAVFTCHGWHSWLERPPRFPQVTYLAISEATRNRIVQREGISLSRTVILHNAVDLRRIPVRPAPLSGRPANACMFGLDASHFPMLEEACARVGVALSKLTGRSMTNPEHELVKYDLVFATGRPAIEALCAGCAVVVCDHQGLGGLVTTADYAHLRSHNFALRALTTPITVASVMAELHRYDVADAVSVTERIRQDANLKTYLDELEQLYIATIAQHRNSPPTRDDIHRAEQYFLHEALPRKPEDPRWPWLLERTAADPEIKRSRVKLRQRTREADQLRVELQQHTTAAEQLRGEVQQRIAEEERLRAELQRRSKETEQLRAELHRRTADAEKMTKELTAIYSSRSWKLTGPLPAFRSSL